MEHYDISIVHTSLYAPRAGPLAVAQTDSKADSKGLRRGFFDRRPIKAPPAPLPRTPAQKPGSRPAAQRSSLKQGSAAAAGAGTNSAQEPDERRDPPPSFEQQQTAFTGAYRRSSGIAPSANMSRMPEAGALTAQQQRMQLR